MYETILVPMDGSKTSERAFEQALSIAQTFNAELILLTVIPENVIPAAVYRTWTHPVMVKRSVKDMLTMARQDATELLTDKLEVCRKQNVKASYKILEGDAASEIIAAAKKRKVDLVVMGSVGLTGIKKLKVMGSVSRKVSEHVSCPVLIVR
jgi:nucleotide-binding universal stress UspA family protein